MSAAESGEPGQGTVLVHPQLSQEPDGRGSATPSCRGSLRGDERTEATHVRGRWPSERWARSGWTSPPRESKTLERYLREPFDYVITVCDDVANEACPFFPGAGKRLHWTFEDPSRVEGSEEDRLAVFRSVRDRIRDRVQAALVDGGG